jgi:hypothetical protein
LRPPYRGQQSGFAATAIFMFRRGIGHGTVSSVTAL